ncbi:ubiquitin carboxyl-terminal hydrolase [Anaeramoeba flamelloides]|uniref:Ubiquitin carboxyl-terminal hydrolase n=1 Tax=Anaeramoeba flamelloides TaxID=1746091 RepID=A0AAV8AE60_9EUKA|nr:ubiquitin carboxyl-terminal hydrolase [Anaeramoeba flamelloides]
MKPPTVTEIKTIRQYQEDFQNIVSNYLNSVDLNLLTNTFYQIMKIITIQQFNNFSNFENLKIFLRKIPIHLSYHIGIYFRNLQMFQYKFNILLFRILHWEIDEFISNWLIEFINYYCERGNYQDLLGLLTLKFRNVFLQLFDAKLKLGAFPFIKFVLLGITVSPFLFHLIIKDYYKLLKSLENSKDLQHKKFFKTLLLLINCLIYKFRGFPELYEPFVYFLNKYEKPTERRMKEIWENNSWFKSFDNQSLSKVYDYSENFIEQERSVEGVGLKNLGNTCFINAFIQSLFLLKSFRNELLKLNLSNKKNKNKNNFNPNQIQSENDNDNENENENESDSEGENENINNYYSENNKNIIINQELQKIFAYLLLSKRAAISITPFLEKLPNRYANRTQQDSSEFGIFLLESLNETIRKKYFGGIQEMSIICSECNNITKKKEEFIQLMLPLPQPGSGSGSGSGSESESESKLLSKSKPNKKKIPTIQQLLKELSKPEILDGDDMYFCSKCNKKCVATRKNQITKYPRYLFITLNRFIFNKKTLSIEKNLSEILPEENFQFDKVNLTFSSAIIHSGYSSNSGHYFTYGKNKNWVLFNDSLVKPTSFEKLKSVQKFFSYDTPYIYFYKTNQMIEEEEKKEETNEKVINKDLLNVITRDNQLFLKQIQDQTNKKKLFSTTSLKK